MLKNKKASIMWGNLGKLIFWLASIAVLGAIAIYIINYLTKLG